MAGRRIPLPKVRAVVALVDMITPYGHGVQAAWEGILSGKTVISKLERFNAAVFVSEYAATIDGLEYLQEESLVMQMLKLMFRRVPTPKHQIPQDAKLILATTKGEVDLLEKRLLEGNNNPPHPNPLPICSSPINWGTTAPINRETTILGEGRGEGDGELGSLLNKVVALTGVADSGLVISAACTSSTSAIARAAAMICSGHTDCVLVVACDAVTEFICSGFSSLMAMDKLPARPFDKRRSGLSIGEAAAYALIMSEARAEREGWEITGEIAGWGLSSDANHMTGPSREAEGQKLAIKKALRMAGADRDDIGFIAAHGTGTVYNDAMEMKAFHAVFGSEPRPVYSIKGAIGHTMGAAGLVETIVALRCLQEGIALPTVNLADVDDLACGWAAPCQKTINNGKMALLTNSGFGGVNAALVLAGAR